MELKDVIALSKAGFTKDEIMALLDNKQQAAEPEKPEAAEPEKPEAAEPEQPEAAADPKEKKDFNINIEEILNKKVEEALAPFNAVYDKMAKLANMPSLPSVEPKGIEDVISNFFKSEE